MKTLETIWASQRWPTLNGITFRDGLYYPIRPTDPPRKQIPLRLEYQKPTAIADFNSQPTTFLIPASEATSQSTDYRVIAGSCSLGEEGFVILTTPTSELFWGAYFDFSNPFERVWFDGTDIIAANNLGEEWHLPLSRPWEITLR